MGTRYDELFSRLEAGAVAITATQRLSRWMLFAYAQWQRGRGLEVWERPRILPWGAFLRRLYDAGQMEFPDLPLAIDGTQEQIVWQQVIRTATAEAGLLQTQGAVRAARDAWRIWQGWRLREPDLEALAAEDGRAFLGWARSYAEELRHRGWIDSARLADVVRRFPRETLGRQAGEFAVLGFDELSPQHTALLDALVEAGWLRWTPPDEAPGNPPDAVRLACADRGAEMLAVAAWARRELERDPTLRIGVVVPDLAGLREPLAAELDRVLCPSVVVGEDGGERPWRVSLGKPLADQPLVADALLALQLLAGRLDLTEWGRLLRSPFTGGAEAERSARGLLDRYLRDEGELEVSLRRLSARLESESERWPACPALAGALGRFAVTAEEAPARAAPGRRAEDILDLLGALGWPGERELDSVEYQALQSFRELLSDFGGMDSVLGPQTLEQAVAAVRQLAQQQLFEPEGDEAASVQVMGVLEAAGLEFDRLWVMGMEDDAWPPPVRVNPLLPASVQRRAGPATASPERASVLAANMTERLRRAAPLSVWSHAVRDGDRELRVSPLIAELPERVPAGDPEYPDYWRTSLRSARLEYLGDAIAPALPVGTPAPGGTAVFQAQSQCPFQAFARFRLDAEPLETGRMGLDARERGSLLHRAMELFWQGIGGRSELDALGVEGRRRTVTEAVARAVGEAAVGRRATFSERFRRLEQGRLVTLILEWLDVELRREAFRVGRTEHKVELEAGGLRFRTRIDRVDRLDDGSEVIVDYKTGRVRLSGLKGERPEEPQLAVYATQYEGEVSGAVFAVIRAGECAYRGVAREARLLPGQVLGPEKLLEPSEAEPTWADLRAHWDRVLNSLATEFREGRADVSPQPKACTYCRLQPLCRIDEASTEAVEEGAADD